MALIIDAAHSPRAQTDDNIATVSATLRGTEDAVAIAAFAECIEWIALLEKVLDDSRVFGRIR